MKHFQKNQCITWHAYIEGKFPLNFLDQSFESWLHKIKTVETKKDTPAQQAIRLKLFKEFKGDLPATLKRAKAAFDEADRALKKTSEWVEVLTSTAGTNIEEWSKMLEEMDETKAAWEKSIEVWNEAKEKSLPDVLVLHAQQCGCAWTPENNNIFDYMTT